MKLTHLPGGTVVDSEGRIVKIPENAPHAVVIPGPGVGEAGAHETLLRPHVVDVDRIIETYKKGGISVEDMAKIVAQDPSIKTRLLKEGLIV